MKLASLPGPGPDGRLIVIDRTVTRGLEVPHIAARLQDALDTWTDVAPRLEEAYAHLNEGAGFPIDSSQFIAPLPRAYQFLDGSAYSEHMSVIRQARGAKLPDGYADVPVIYQGTGAPMMGPRDPIIVPDKEGLDLDFEAELIVITDAVPLGASARQAERHIRLIGLLNDVSFRAFVPTEVARGMGLIHSKPLNAMAPILVTPDELGAAWVNAKASGRYKCEVNGVRIGELDPGADLMFSYAELLAYAARTRPLAAGTVLGAGAIANKDRANGCGCLAELRARQTLEGAAVLSPYLREGDRVTLAMYDAAGRSVFGTIDQTVVTQTALN
ncbi:Fumarylacetoacetate (FAA) hydrolase family protein [compost metagenome]